ncbi:histidine kinase [Mitsuaria sp. GD03876]|uniref:sensor histidine kinase n=1 Tax=Mitsuaria sp. GD03876 TaxID=2975399 RepID=UPI00244D69D9|nr:histidine kinase [Mitsuaria sp. GD03876]MDH0867004.1 histidine kinase [Mitsuaria sp. GD03876]
MTSATLARLIDTDRRELLLAAALAVALAAGLVLPQRLACSLGVLAGACSPEQGWLRLWMGLSAWYGALWALAILTQRWLPATDRPRGLAVQILALTLIVPTLGALLGMNEGQRIARSAYELQMHAMFATVACLTVEYHRRRRRGEADAASMQVDARTLARQLDEARSALLQAQVEPHFLFNTLAHLRRLAQTDPAAAREMLSELRRYLSAALPDLRQTQTPLARELELVRAFLALHQRRIGPERLTVVFDIAPGLDEAIVPSTSLLTLAENAIKHGITPQVDGGEIAVRAGPDPERPGQLRLEVADTGVGMSAGSGGGTGLVTLRARLAALYGAEARLTLLLNEPSGLIARIQLPRRSA